MERTMWEKDAEAVNIDIESTECAISSAVLFLHIIEA